MISMKVPDALQRAEQLSYIDQALLPMIDHAASFILLIRNYDPSGFRIVEAALQ